ncbi:hypothetical protein Acr_07g0011010 [Actinidia rufa]|uniref:Uncharacterized protein n=1 Tax=Actinidia rufa TaxID=165716 RepID=A0A7J0EWR6_9ERIC|nr:hypothetical protein Acr_07g0011010 [Actinidia rufa]
MHLALVSLPSILHLSPSVNQLPLAPPKESFPRDELLDQGKNLEVDTYSSPATIINTMTQDDLDHLRESYSFPIRVQTRIPEEGETILSTCTGEVPLHLVQESMVRLGVALLQGMAVVLDSRAFQMCFTLDHAEMSSSGGDNTEDRLIKEIGIVGNEGMSKRISLKKLTQNVEEAEGVSLALKFTPAVKGVIIGETRPRKENSNVLLSEVKSKGKALPLPAAKKTKSATSNSSSMIKGAKLALAPKEGTSINHGTAPRPEASMLGSVTLAEKVLSGVIPPANNEKVNNLSLDQVVTKFFHIIGLVPIHFYPRLLVLYLGEFQFSLKLVYSKAIMLRSSLTVQSRDIRNETTFYIARAESTEIEMVRAQNQTIELEWLLDEIAEKDKMAGKDLKTKSDALVRLKEKVAELKKNEVLSKKKVVEEYKASEEFYKAIENASSKYFSERLLENQLQGLVCEHGDGMSLEIMLEFSSENHEHIGEFLNLQISIALTAIGKMDRYVMSSSPVEGTVKCCKC